jgi:hypothetical protein
MGGRRGRGETFVFKSFPSPPPNNTREVLMPPSVIRHRRRQGTRGVGGGSDDDIEVMVMIPLESLLTDPDAACAAPSTTSQAGPRNEMKDALQGHVIVPCDRAIISCNRQ